MKKGFIFLLLIAGSAFAAKGPFTTCDADKDGFLNKEEFIKARTETAKAYWEKRGQDWTEKHPDPIRQFGAMFVKWDKDKDGRISLEEWKAAGK